MTRGSAPPPGAAQGEAQRGALALAGDLDGIMLEARRLAALSPGAHGRRRAGQGEAFWQFRDYRPEDGARLVDWRRSARGERLYVREREREAAQIAQIWIDPDPGFAWSSDPRTLPLKRERALVMTAAFAILLVRGGERVAAAGAGSFAGPGAAEQLCQALQAEPSPEIFRPALHGCVVFASDFYGPLEAWERRLAACASAGARATLLSVTDPAEEDFPFEGRTRFDPIGAGESITFGRAESARAAYQERLARHRAQLADMAAAFDAALILHRSDHHPALAFTALLAAATDRPR